MVCGAAPGGLTEDMQIQVNFGDVDGSQALRDHSEEQVTKAVDHFRDQITAIEVFLHDENADKHGARDKRVVIEARFAGHDPFAVEERGDDMYQTITAAAHKLKSAGQRLADKRKEHR